jgi:hypothetical protein
VVHLRLRVGPQDVSLNRAKRERRCSGCAAKRWMEYDGTGQHSAGWGPRAVSDGYRKHAAQANWRCACCSHLLPKDAPSLLPRSKGGPTGTQEHLTLRHAHGQHGQLGISRLFRGCCSRVPRFEWLPPFPSRPFRGFQPLPPTSPTSYFFASSGPCPCPLPSNAMSPSVLPRGSIWD